MINFGKAVNLIRQKYNHLQGVGFVGHSAEIKKGFL
jgi:hypothetical protein